MKLLLALLTITIAAAANAHIGAPMHEQAGTNWTWPPWVAISLAAASGCYGAGLLRLWRAHRLTRVLGSYRPLAFIAGIAALIIALLSPLDALADRSFAAHMSQHILLMMVAAPLLIWSRPVLTALWLLPLRQRRRLGRGWHETFVLRRTYEFFMQPLSAWLLVSAVLWIWHIPRIYNLALANEAIHIVEHLSFFFTSLLFWSLVSEPQQVRAIGHVTAMLMVLTYGIQNGLLGALLTFAQTSLYLHYDNGVLSPTVLHDQQLAGVIMWVPAGIAHLTTFTWLFADCLAAARRRTPKRIPWSLYLQKNAPPRSAGQLVNSVAQAPHIHGAIGDD